jgi:hypothetical protein
MITFRIDQGRRLIEVTAVGTVSAQEFFDAQAELRADPAFDVTFAVLADYRAANFSALVFTQVRQIAERDPFGASSPRALLVRDPGDLSLVQLFQAYVDMAARAGPVRVFQDVDAALAWIEDVRGA